MGVGLLVSDCLLDEPDEILLGLVEGVDWARHLGGGIVIEAAGLRTTGSAVTLKSCQGLYIPKSCLFTFGPMFCLDTVVQ